METHLSHFQRRVFTRTCSLVEDQVNVRPDTFGRWGQAQFHLSLRHRIRHLRHRPVRVLLLQHHHRLGALLLLLLLLQHLALDKL